MKPTKFVFLLFAAILFACKADDVETKINAETDIESDAPNQVLMLKVDYTTNTFDGGTILGFSKKNNNFTIEDEYVPPGDFGSVKLIYKELNEPLFFGTIHWMGLGEMTFPEKLEPADSFKHTLTNDVRYPKGFEGIVIPESLKINYEKPWLSVQGLLKVRQFLADNPEQKVKMFLYTPSIGEGNPEDWFWMIYLKK